MPEGNHQRLKPEEMIPEDIVVKPGKEGDLACGIGSCKPKGLQKCANIKLFTVLLAFQMLLHLTLFTYYRGVIRTVERRFGFSTKDTGVIGSVGDAVQTVFVLFVGYFGRKTHKPRYLSISFIFSGLGAIMLSLPYFIYGPLKYDDVGMSTALMNHTRHPPGGHGPAAFSINYQMCDGIVSNASDGGMCGAASAGSQTLGVESSTTAFNIFLVAFIILNLSGSGIWTLAIAFIYENLKKEDSGLYIGFVQSMFSIGPIFGFSLAAATTRLPEDLQETSLSPRDPQFIGCWWLGGVIIGGLMIVSTLPLFFFPKHFPDYYRYHKAPVDKRRVSRTDMNPVLFEMKQFGRSFLKLITSPAVVFLVLSKVCVIYFVIGILINMPRYIEIHFHKPAFIANIGAAVSGALTGAVGNLLGGVIMKKARMQPVGSARMYILSLIITIAGLTAMMMLACQQAPLYGQVSPNQQALEVSNQCNTDCGCDRDRLQTVCSPDGEKYFSPCHAGCRSGSNGTYTECSCTSSANVTTLSSSFCGEDCQLFIPYLATFMIIILLVGTARVPATILLFRIVDEDLKAFVMGILSSLINLLGFVPGPIMYGLLFDSTCLLWQSKCGSRGACMIYDITGFRYYMHGVTIGFQTLGLFFAFALYYFVVKMFKGKKETADPVVVEIEREAMLALNDKSDEQAHR